ncbi:MAG: metallophosphoesterase family protein [Phycisphaerales bacterium]|nr:metallophosphoesterase family protein [Phycisphaerales bacterium]
MSKSRPNGKFTRARLRHALFTRGADKLLGGRLLERHLEDQIEVHTHDVSIPNWPEEFDGIRIGHLTDLHLGDLMPRARVDETLALLSEQDVDLIAFTGDAVDLECAGVEHFFESLAAVPAPLGHYLVLGNHDYLDDGEAVARAAREAGITVLLDEMITVQGEGERPLRVGGVDWAKRLPDCTEKVQLINGDEDQLCDLLLSHNPKSFIEAARLGVPLTLAGHTHGGQVAIKGRPDRNLAVAHRLSAGFYERSGSVLFVSTGVGAWFPLRVHCPPEIAVLEVRRGDWSDPIEDAVN